MSPILIILLILLIYYYFTRNTENFGNYIFGFPSRINRPTRNMSYDIRGEAYFPPFLNLPFNNTNIEPLNKPFLI